MRGAGQEKDYRRRYGGVYPVHPAGWMIVGGCWIGVAIIMMLWPMIGIGLLPVAIWCVWFFRDPYRQVPSAPHAIISPADGRIVDISQHPPPKELEMGRGSMRRIGIFMNVFDVHVNRVPMDGVITRRSYSPGRFFNASLDKASEHNERMALTIRGKDGVSIACVQIAGLIARRIECAVEPKQKVRRGDRFGIIRFGSRVDLYLPMDVDVDVRISDRVRAGETVVARMKPRTKPRMKPGMKKGGKA